MGILLTDKGIGPTAERVRAIAEAREPESASEVRSFLGLVSYSSRFIPDFATVSEPLRRLIKKDTEFVFGEEQRKAFSELKGALAKAGTLRQRRTYTSHRRCEPCWPRCCACAVSTRREGSDILRQSELE